VVFESLCSGNGLLVAVRHVVAAQGKAGGVEMIEARVDAFLDTDGQGELTQQQITAIGGHLLERAAELETVEQVCVDACMKQEIEGCVGKKLRRQGQWPIGKPQAIDDHPGHGFAWRQGFLCIGHEACVDHRNEA
jgi:hypothetical protein